MHYSNLYQTLPAMKMLDAFDDANLLTLKQTLFSFRDHGFDAIDKLLTSVTRERPDEIGFLHIKLTGKKLENNKLFHEYNNFVSKGVFKFSQTFKERVLDEYDLGSNRIDRPSKYGKVSTMILSSQEKKSNEVAYDIFVAYEKEAVATFATLRGEEFVFDTKLIERWFIRTLGKMGIIGADRFRMSVVSNTRIDHLNIVKCHLRQHYDIYVSRAITSKPDTLKYLYTDFENKLNPVPVEKCFDGCCEPIASVSKGLMSKMTIADITKPGEWWYDADTVSSYSIINAVNPNRFIYTPPSAFEDVRINTIKERKSADTFEVEIIEEMPADVKVRKPRTPKKEKVVEVEENKVAETFEVSEMIPEPKVKVKRTRKPKVKVEEEVKAEEPQVTVNAFQPADVIPAPENDFAPWEEVTPEENVKPALNSFDDDDDFSDTPSAVSSLDDIDDFD